MTHPLRVFHSFQKHQIYFLIVLEAGSPRSKGQQVWFLLMSLSLVCRWPPSGRVLTWSFLGAHVPLASLCVLKMSLLGFPGGTVVESLPANAGDTGSSPGLGRSHMPQSSWAHEPQLLSLRVWSLWSATSEAAVVRGPCTAMKSGPRLPQLEKALTQKRGPNTAINKLKKKKCLSL